jgi:hypothetical protein
MKTDLYHLSSLQLVEFEVFKVIVFVRDRISYDRKIFNRFGTAS